MATPSVKSPPRGRDQILEAVLDAAERLFSASEPDAVSLRAVAAEAGVTYSLVNRHIGTREALYDALIARFEERWRDRFATADDLDELLDLLIGDPSGMGVYLRLLGWTMLGASDDAAARSHEEHSVLRHLVPLAGGDDASDRVVTSLALVFGYRFFSRYLLATVGRGPDDAERVHALIAGVARRLAAPSP